MVKFGARTLLMQAGVDISFWPFACRALSLARNISMTKDLSRWYRRHGTEFEGKRWPFGAKVTFKVAKLLAKKLEFSANGEPGIFFGYF